VCRCLREKYFFLVSSSPLRTVFVANRQAARRFVIPWFSCSCLPQAVLTCRLLRWLVSLDTSLLWGFLLFFQVVLVLGFLHEDQHPSRTNRSSPGENSRLFRARDRDHWTTEEQAVQAGDQLLRHTLPLPSSPSPASKFCVHKNAQMHSTNAHS